MMCRSEIFTRPLSLLLLTIFLIACSSGGDGGAPSGGTSGTPDPQPEILTGVFLDSLVSGVNYRTETQSGMTNTNGEFNYINSEHVAFSIDGIVLGATQAGPVVTPLMLVDGAMDATDPRVINIVRLLMTLDSDGNPGNGIEIPALAHTAATGLTVDFASAAFATDVQALVDAVKGPGTQLVDAGSAQNHFNTSLKTSWGTMTWGADCWNQVCQESN
ncbi:MAG: hypothetical protein L0Z73_14645 [Gammaproteobacteria bacterium]|nr:hypothetical protein [Gammaproteobacteria bacterium]